MYSKQTTHFLQLFSLRTLIVVDVDGTMLSPKNVLTGRFSSG